MGKVVIVGFFAVVHAAKDGIGEVDAYLCWVGDQLRQILFEVEGVRLTSAYLRFEAPFGSVEAILIVVVLDARALGTGEDVRRIDR